MLTDAAGHTVWRGRYGAWGGLEGEEKAEGIHQPLRLQNQYCDEETGLHYNFFRYYDPVLGRFISQDPIGLAGGLNAYRFAPNAQGWVDPLGLEAAAPSAEGVLSMGAGAAGEGVVGRVLSALVRYNPVLWVLMLSGDTPESQKVRRQLKPTPKTPPVILNQSGQKTCGKCTETSVTTGGTIATGGSKPPPDDDNFDIERDKRQARRMSDKQLEEMFGKDWHRTNLKSRIAMHYRSELRGSKNFDFFRNPKTGNIYGRGNINGRMFKIDDRLLK